MMTISGELNSDLNGKHMMANCHHDILKITLNAAVIFKISEPLIGKLLYFFFTKRQHIKKNAKYTQAQT